MCLQSALNEGLHSPVQRTINALVIYNKKHLIYQSIDHLMSFPCSPEPGQHFPKQSGQYSDTARLITCAVRALGPHPLPIEPEKGWSHDSHAQADETQKAVPPSQSQGPVQAVREKREAEPSHRPHKSSHSGGARRIPCIGIDHVGLTTLEADDKADGKQRGADVGRYPVGLVLRCPAVDKQASGDNEPPRNHQGKAVFWPAIVAIVLGKSLIYLSK